MSNNSHGALTDTAIAISRKGTPLGSLRKYLILRWEDDFGVSTAHTCSTSALSQPRLTLQEE